jgi:hypothetical protein
MDPRPRRRRPAAEPTASTSRSAATIDHRRHSYPEIQSIFSSDLAPAYWPSYSREIPFPTFSYYIFHTASSLTRTRRRSLLCHQHQAPHICFGIWTYW